MKKFLSATGLFTLDSSCSPLLPGASRGPPPHQESWFIPQLSWCPNSSAGVGPLEKEPSPGLRHSEGDVGKLWPGHLMRQIVDLRSCPTGALGVDGMLLYFGFCGGKGCFEKFRPWQTWVLNVPRNRITGDCIQHWLEEMPQRGQIIFNFPLRSAKGLWRQNLFHVHRHVFPELSIRTRRAQPSCLFQNTATW